MALGVRLKHIWSGGATRRSANPIENRTRHLSARMGVRVNTAHDPSTPGLNWKNENLVFLKSRVLTLMFSRGSSVSC